MEVIVVATPCNMNIALRWASTVFGSHQAPRRYEIVCLQTSPLAATPQPAAYACSLAPGASRSRERVRGVVSTCWFTSLFGCLMLRYCVCCKASSGTLIDREIDLELLVFSRIADHDH